MQVTLISLLGGKDNATLIIAGIAIVTIVFLQVRSFLSTRRVILNLRYFFPEVNSLKVKKFRLDATTISSDKLLKKFLRNPIDDADAGDPVEVGIIVPDNPAYGDFKSMLDKTNAYLCRNTGTSAEFSVLTDICEHQLDTIEEEAYSSLNVPLFLGLAGTFIGIILGLIGVDFKEIFTTGDNSTGTEVEQQVFPDKHSSESADNTLEINLAKQNSVSTGNSEEHQDSSTEQNSVSANNLVGLQHLLYGVITAMFASLLGLGLTVYNSTIAYKEAVRMSSNKKEEYFDYLRREIMPILSSSMSRSLESLRGVLSHFIGEFGRNLDAYADSASLLNNNLEKQHLVLLELNKLGITKTANKIAETFQSLEKSAESLEVFKSYQSQLNTTITGMTGAVTKMDDLIKEFEGFKKGLNAVVASQDENARIQDDFKKAIVTHFPTGSEGREVWRTEFDTLIKDAKDVTTQLSDQLTQQTQHIKNFVSDNSKFFDSGFKDVLDTLVKYTDVQAQCYKDLKTEITELRKDYKDAQADTLQLTKETQKAIKAMTDKIAEIKQPTGK